MKALLLTAMVLLAVALPLAGAFLYAEYTIEEVVDIPVIVRVDDHFGLAVDADQLHFGRLMPNTSTDKIFLVNNTKNHELAVDIIARGETAPWIRFSKAQFSLKPGGSQNITATLTASTSEFGEYHGTVRVTLKRPLFPFS